MKDIVGLPKQTSELAKVVREYWDNQKENEELRFIIAKERRDLYESYIKLGFSKNESFELLKAELFKIEMPFIGDK